MVPASTQGVRALRARPEMALFPLRIFLGVTFVYAGIQKLSDPGFLHPGRVFERFHRARPAGGRGSGLGLAIARAIVEAHDGKIWADESASGGARVAFELPGFTPD